MKILIELSFENYYRLLAACEPSSQEHAIIKKAVFLQNPGDRFDRKFVIRCELEEAEILLAIVKQDCPEAVSEIEKAIALARRA
jgi:hypothetical protein